MTRNSTSGIIATMKPILLFLSCGAVAALILILFSLGTPWHSQAAAPTGTSTLAPPEPSQTSKALPEFLLIDRNTWELIDRDGRVIDGEINSQQAKYERYVADLAITNPEEYERLFPPTEEAKAAHAAAMEAIRNSKSVEEILADIKDPADLATWKAAMRAIENPQPVTEDMIEALKADPTGIWSKMHELIPAQD